MSEQPDPVRAEASTDRLRLAAVGVVAVVLSLIGFSVSSRFQPPPVPSQPVADQVTTTTGSPTTLSAPTTTLSEAQRTTTTQEVLEDAALALSEELLDFGEEAGALELEVMHIGGGPGSWSLASESPALSFAPSEGRLAGGSAAGVTVTLDRSQIEEGEFEAPVTLSWEAGEIDAAARAVFEDDPIIHNPSASPSSVVVDGGGECAPTRTTVSARVRDTSEVDQVIARWSPDGSSARETAMRPVGNDMYEGLIGPFDTARTDDVKVVAFDVRGNAGGASVSLTIAACP